jgi:diacylglycerol kinase family enzyme
VKLLLLVNSSASAVTPRSRVVIGKALSADHDVTVAETSRRGHATRLAQGAAASDVDGVVVLGGDGTVNEAANGLAGSTCTLAALPGGSTNVFARTIGLPNDPVEATGDLLGALARRSIRRVGLGSVNGRYFLFHTGVGFDAAVVHQVERRAALKRYASHPLFVYAAFDTWLRHYDRSRPRFALEGFTVAEVATSGNRLASTVDAPNPQPNAGHDVVDDVVDDGYLTIVLNTSPYTYFGNRPLDLDPEASLDRALTAVTLRSLGLFRILRLVGSALGRSRALRRSRWVDFRTDLAGFTVRTYGPVPYQVDGEYLGNAEELVFRHEPNVLDLVLP